MKKPIVVNYASAGRDDYFRRQLNLIRSLKESNLDYDTYFVADGGYCDEYLGIKISPDFPQVNGKIFHRHNDIKYQFKLAMIFKAAEMGYTKIFWADSTFHFVEGKDLCELLDKSESGVLAFHNLGHELSDYISDKAMANLLIEARELPLIKQCFGGFWGFDLSKETAKKVLLELYYQSNLGSYNDGGSKRKGFIAHRHDQAVMSVICHNFGIPLFDYGGIVYSPHHLPPHEYGTEFYGYFA